jgi:hypothetical protein
VSVLKVYFSAKELVFLKYKSGISRGYNMKILHFDLYTFGLDINQDEILTPTVCREKNHVPSSQKFADTK